MKAAKESRDQTTMIAAQKEVWDTYRAAGVKLWKMAVPMIQIPLGYGTFRLMRGMAALPVPGLEDGGFLWIKDLTLADPLFLLPILTSGAFYYTFKVRRQLLTLLLACSDLAVCAERWRARILRFYHESITQEISHIRVALHIRSIHARLASMHAAVVFFHLFVLDESSLASKATLDAGLARHPTSPHTTHL